MVREIKRHSRNAHGAELDPDADTTSEAPNRFVQHFLETVPGMTAASDVALGGCEGKKRRDCW